MRSPRNLVCGNLHGFTNIKQNIKKACMRKTPTFAQQICCLLQVCAPLAATADCPGTVLGALVTGDGWQKVHCKETAPRNRATFAAVKLVTRRGPMGGGDSVTEGRYDWTRPTPGGVDPEGLKVRFLNF